MNYELAKKLKDAGYPQKCIKGDFMSDRYSSEEGWEESNCYIPSLSELIEATPQMSQLDKHYDGEWRASYMPMPEHGKDIFGFGKTPEIAVSMLYLALHEKD